ncbi:alanine racemase [Cryptosporangium aurantiacum]|uniref:Alanine racemase n=1 Tax=Cryptosporangium aurantiacum TaxID=134849 RepID=A0A1M7QVS7_9ACTN|nr:alanine racemase [Cryptosporangium aurantiacum]SHN36036.1 alanine racemase [Cryptosporangium aurantiacum]
MVQAEAVIDLDAIRANTAYLAERAATRSAATMAVVKADGYGHGAVPSARAALAGGATWLGVSTVGEALELRAAGIDSPLLSWLNAPGTDFTAAVVSDVDLGVPSIPLLDDVVASAKRADRTARVHLKVDTGLGRSGATPADWPDLLTAAAKATAEGTVEVVGVWSHFACADEPGHPSIAAQIGVFHEALEVADRHGVHPQLRHMANSAGTLTLPEAYFDLVRPGVSIYGLSPNPGHVPAEALRPAMTLRGRVLIAKRVPAGHGVSYGHTYHTSAPTTLAVVPLGYGDGVPRHASSVGPLLLGGVRRRIAGRVCMDQFVVDVGDDPVSDGDEAVLFGPGDRGEPTADDWAEAVGTINYEIVTRIGARVPRTYVGAGA